MREKTQADFDLERVMDLFDNALTSKDERVVNALRQLLMIVALTAPESNDGITNKNVGPFRQLQDDLNNLHRRITALEHEVMQQQQSSTPSDTMNPYNGTSNSINPMWALATGLSGLELANTNIDTQVDVTNAGAVSGAITGTPWDSTILAARGADIRAILEAEEEDRARLNNNNK